MLRRLRTRLPEVVRAIAPLVGLVCLLQLLVGASAGVFLQFLAGSIVAALGMLVAALGMLVALARSVALALLPLAALFMVCQVLLLKLPRVEVSRILTGTLFASGGLFLLLVGVNIGFLPFGRAIGDAVGPMPGRWLLATR